MIPIQDHDGVSSILDGFPGSEFQVSCMPDKPFITTTNSEDWREVSFRRFSLIFFVLLSLYERGFHMTLMKREKKSVFVCFFRYLIL